MSVTNAISSVSAPSYGAPGTFPFSFKIFLNTDLVITATKNSTGVVYPLTLTTDYTVALNGAAPNTGVVTLAGAYFNLVAGYTILIKRVLPITQLIDLVDNEETPAATYEEEFDRGTMVDQQLKQLIDDLTTLIAAFPTFPAPSPGETLAWDTTGNVLVNIPSLIGPAGPVGPQGPAGPTGSGTGDVLGPAANDDSYVPQWNLANSKVLKNGLHVGTTALSLVQLDAAAKLPAVDGSQLTGLPSGLGDVIGPAHNTDLYVPQWNGADSKTLKDGLAVGTGANDLVQLDAGAKLPAVDGSQLTGITATNVPVGTILLWSAAAAPTGFLICNGAAVSRTVTYNTLFALIGTTYGIGDNVNTYNIPDLRANIPVGYKAADADFGTLGGTGGEKTHQLITAEMPGHTHTGSASAANVHGLGLSGTLADYGAGTSGSTGGDGAHNNLQPYLTIQYIIKY